MGGTRALLFGASGFVGARVEVALLEDPRVGELIRVGRRDTGEPNCVRHDLVSDGVEQLADLLRETSPDVVINCTGGLGGDSPALVRANVVVTAHLLAATAAAAPTARLVGLGSAAEYGVIPFGERVSEAAYERPVSVYGVTKLASTGLIRVAVRQGEVDAVVLRPFNPIGPGVPRDSVLGRAAASMREAREAGRDHIVLGPLGAYRDFVDVRDVATAIAAAADSRVRWLSRIRRRTGRRVWTGLPRTLHGSIKRSAGHRLMTCAIRWPHVGALVYESHHPGVPHPALLLPGVAVMRRRGAGVIGSWRH